MAIDEHRSRARSFGAVAEDYDRIRPGYPDALVDDALAYAGIAPADGIAAAGGIGGVGGERAGAVRVLEVGAGTGRATLAFADRWEGADRWGPADGGAFGGRGVAVTALEPDPAMAAVLSRRTAGRPGITVRVAAYEDIDVPEPFDLIISGQAWHWTDPTTRWERTAAALRPGGALAMFWNRDQLADPDCAAALIAVHERVAPELDATLGPVRKGRQVPAADPPDGPRSQWPLSDLVGRAEFGDLVERQYRWTRQLSAADYTALLNTHSEYRILADGTRRRLLDAIGAALPDRVELTVVTVLCLARRT